MVKTFGSCNLYLSLSVQISKTETKTSIIVFNTNEGFLRVTAKPDCVVELEDAQHDFKEAARLVNHLRLPVLADGRNYADHTREVRDFYSSKEIAEKIAAMAILVDSLPSRIIGNFFITTSKPHFPTKLFTDETAAVKWLNGILKKEKQPQY